MRIPRFKLLLLTAVAVAGATAAVALGSPTRATDTTPITQALAKTGHATSGHFAFTLNISGGGTSGGTFALTGKGGYDTIHKTSAFSLDLGSLSSVLGSASGGASIPSKVQVVSTGSALYVYLPSLASRVRKGAEWIKFTSSAVPSSVTKGVKPSDFTNVDPTKALQQLTASVTVHKAGTATVRGTPTTHYRVSVDTTKLVSLVPKSQQASLTKSLSTLKLKTVPIDVYVSHGGYVRRVSASLSHLAVQKGSAPVSLSLQVDLYDFGIHVHVSPPPAAKTVSGDALVKQLIPSGSG
jgi:hypothetical protein